MTDWKETTELDKDINITPETSLLLIPRTNETHICCWKAWPFFEDEGRGKFITELVAKEFKYYSIVTLPAQINSQG